MRHTLAMTESRTPTKTICIPARNESATIGKVVRSLRWAADRSDIGLESILVVDDRSTDNTAAIAAHAGARVVSTSDLCAQFGGSRGKGDAIWASLRACETELIGWADGDLGQMNPLAILEIFRPLISEDNAQLVKGKFDRLVNGNVSGEGRVTALTARPLLGLLHPEFPDLSQPLSGIFAGRTAIIGGLWLDCDYGVDIGITLDICEIFGNESVREGNIGQISHRRRPLSQLATTASQVSRAIIARAGISTSIVSDLQNRRVPALNFQPLRIK